MNETQTERLKINVNAVPAELKPLPQWVGWRHMRRDGKDTKAPVNPRNGKLAKSNDPGTWGSFEEALALVQAGDADGVGFVLAPPYVGIDLDDVYDPSLEPFAASIVKALRSYTEVSPGSRGVHILVKGTLHSNRNKAGCFEVYDRGRFFTMTGKYLEGTPREIAERTQELAQVCDQVFGPNRAVNGHRQRTPAKPCEHPYAPNGFDIRQHRAVLDGWHETTRGYGYAQCPVHRGAGHTSLWVCLVCGLFGCWNGCSRIDVHHAVEQLTAKRRGEKAWRLCEPVAREPRILDRFAVTLARRGVVGEARAAKLTYLSVTSRLLDRPVSLVVKGQSSGGKSFLVKQVIEFFPPSAYYELTAMSERCLAYWEEPMKHRVLLIFEAAGVQGETGNYLVRSLLSEGRIRYGTVDKSQGEGLKSRLIEREGPTGLITTTTSISLHPENETRLFSVRINESPEQTRAVMLSAANDTHESGAAGLEQWLALQEWLETAEHRVVIPYAEALAEAIPPVAVRLRRDFPNTLSLIKAHAILHQANRQRDPEGRVIAKLEDYESVRDLIEDLISEGLEVSVPKGVEEVVESVLRLAEMGEGLEPKFATLGQIAEDVKRDKSTVSRNVREAIKRGWLVNHETQRGKPYRLTPGDPMPEHKQILLPRPK